MVSKPARPIHLCECPLCRQKPRCATASEHRSINRLLAVADERMRRLLAGLLASRAGRGGIRLLAQITGLHRNTVALGKRELQQKRRFALNRVRRSGAGRKRLEEKRPGHLRPCKNFWKMPRPAIRSLA
jgi:hypothetical protein